LSSPEEFSVDETTNHLQCTKVAASISEELQTTFVKHLSSLVVDLKRSDKRVQFYVFGGLEHSAMIKLLIDFATKNTSSDESSLLADRVEQCIAALVDQTGIISISSMRYHLL